MSHMLDAYENFSTCYNYYLRRRFFYFIFFIEEFKEKLVSNDNIHGFFFNKF